MARRRKPDHEEVRRVGPAGHSWRASQPAPSHPARPGGGRAMTMAALAGVVTAGAAVGLYMAGPTRAGEHVASSAGTVFGVCHTGGGTNCVVDGDTAWVDGVKVRVADIDAPETHPPRCDAEAELGDRATRRLAELMSAGPFEMRVADRDEDRYGRKLRVLVRGGRSLGDQLVAEGLARTWEGRRRPWC